MMTAPPQLGGGWPDITGGGGGITRGAGGRPSSSGSGPKKKNDNGNTRLKMFTLRPFGVPRAGAFFGGGGACGAMSACCGGCHGVHAFSQSHVAGARSMLCRCHLVTQDGTIVAEMRHGNVARIRIKSKTNGVTGA